MRRAAVSATVVQLELSSYGSLSFSWSLFVGVSLDGAARFLGGGVVGVVDLGRVGVVVVVVLSPVCWFR